jgi:hypothetical protein
MARLSVVGICQIMRQSLGGRGRGARRYAGIKAPKHGPHRRTLAPMGGPSPRARERGWGLRLGWAGWDWPGWPQLERPLLSRRWAACSAKEDQSQEANPAGQARRGRHRISSDGETHDVQGPLRRGICAGLLEKKRSILGPWRPPKCLAMGDRNGSALEHVSGRRRLRRVEWSDTLGSRPPRSAGLPGFRLHLSETAAPSRSRDQLPSPRGSKV